MRQKEDYPVHWKPKTDGQKEVELRDKLKRQGLKAQELLASHAPELIGMLLDIARNDEDSNVRLREINSLLDRGIGRPAPAPGESEKGKQASAADFIEAFAQASRQATEVMMETRAAQSAQAHDEPPRGRTIDLDDAVDGEIVP